MSAAEALHIAPAPASPRSLKGPVSPSLLGPREPFNPSRCCCPKSCCYCRDIVAAAVGLWAAVMTMMAVAAAVGLVAAVMMTLMIAVVAVVGVQHH